MLTFLWSTRVLKKSSWWRLLCRYMFVEYESHRAAALARKKLVQGSVFLFGQEIGQVWTRVLKLLSASAKNIFLLHLTNQNMIYQDIKLAWSREEIILKRQLLLFSGWLGWTWTWGGWGNNVDSKGEKFKIFYIFTASHFIAFSHGRYTFSKQRKKSLPQYFCFRSSLLETWCCQPQKQLCANCSIDSATMRWKYLHSGRFSANNANFQVERVKKAKDYAFVHFSSRDAAERALAASKGLVIDEADVRL